MSVAGYVFYFMMLGFGTMYGFLLISNPCYTISVPIRVWETERHWAKVVAWLYAAVVFGMITMGAMLIPLLHLPEVRRAVGVATLVMAILSIIGDIRWHSRPGLALDCSILFCSIMFLSLA